MFLSLFEVVLFKIQEKLLRDYEAQQRLKNDKNLQLAKQSNVDKIVSWKSRNSKTLIYINSICI